MAEVCWLFQGCRADVNFRSDIRRHLRLKQSGSGVQCMCSLHSFADLTDVQYQACNRVGWHCQAYKLHAAIMIADIDICTDALNSGI